MFCTAHLLKLCVADRGGLSEPGGVDDLIRELNDDDVDVSN